MGRLQPRQVPDLITQESGDLGNLANSTQFSVCSDETFVETYEMFYGGNREEGRSVINSYCVQKQHLQVPKPEHLLLPKPDLSLNLPPLKMPPQPKPSAQVGQISVFHRFCLLSPSSKVRSSEKKLRKLKGPPLAFVQGRWQQKKKEKKQK